MKNRLFIIVGLLLLITSSFAQDLNKKYMDPKLEKQVLIGNCDTTGLQEGVFGIYYITQFEVYKPKQSIVNKIEAITKKGGVSVVTVFGDWCSDSKLQVPRFYKLLSEMNFPLSSTKLIAVNRSKKVPDMDISEYKILKVPTFIVYFNEQEIGRIVESPDSTLEKNLLKILKSLD